MVLTNYETGQDSTAVIGDQGGAEYDQGQGFQVQVKAWCTSVELYLQDGAGTSPTDDVTVRLETDAAGVPSGTLISANATGTISAASITGSLQFLTVTFATPVLLQKDTQYHLTAGVPNQANDVNFRWGRDATDATYAYGVLEYSENGGAWNNVAGATHDFYFRVNGYEIKNTGSPMFFGQGVTIG